MDEKHCNNCRFKHIAFDEEPCNDCCGINWEPLYEEIDGDLKCVCCEEIVINGDCGCALN